MTMTDERPTDLKNRLEMSTEELAAAGLRWMSKAEHTAACALRDNYADPTSADRDLPRQLPILRQQLENAVAALTGLQFELKHRSRELVTSEGVVHEVPSPFFCDDQGRDEQHWRDEAAAARAELSKVVKAGAPRDEAELQALCDLRLREASALATADRIAFNPVLLRRAVGEAREEVRRLERDLTDLTRRGAPYLEPGR